MGRAHDNSRAAAALALLLLLLLEAISAVRTGLLLGPREVLLAFIAAGNMLLLDAVGCRGAMAGGAVLDVSTRAVDGLRKFYQW